MPISRYRCKKCGKEFQIFQKITDTPLQKCSFCEGKVDLIPTPLFYNTPSFSLAFLEKEDKQAPPPTPKKKVQAKENVKPKKQATSKKAKTNKQNKTKKTNKSKKMKK